MELPERLFIREVRDEEFDCEAFTTKPLKLGERADCETDGHYRCQECSRRDSENFIDANGATVPLMIAAPGQRKG